MSRIPTYSNPLEFDYLMLEPVHEMMHKGIRIDLEEKERLKENNIEHWVGFQEKLNQVAGRNINVLSPPQVNKLLYKELKMPPKYKQRRLTSNEDALRAIMADCKGKMDNLTRDSAKERWMKGYAISHFILKIRAVRKELSSYLGLHIKAGEIVGPIPLEDDDGRIRGSISVGGTETARFTHSKSPWRTGVNLATIPRGLRSMYIPDKGYEFAEFDLNRGESWVYAHLSKDPTLMEIHQSGRDFHAETASVISSAFGKPLSVAWIKENAHGDAYKIRYTGKRVNHATSYRMKSYTGAAVINKEAEDTGVTVTVGQVKKAQSLWLEKYFGIPNWWRAIEADLDRSRTMVTPYGRIHQFHGAWGNELFKTATAYVPQSTSVDYLNRGFLKVYHLFVKKKAWDLSILAQTHDSILVQYKKEHRDEAIPMIAEQLRSKLVVNKMEFEIPIEASYGENWRQLEEWKK